MAMPRVEDYSDELGEVDWAEYNAAMEARMEELFEEWQEMIDEAFKDVEVKE